MPGLTDLAADLRFTARLFRKNPAFSLIAIASMALGIGASSAIFSLVYAVLLDPYPYKNADRIVAPAIMEKQKMAGRMYFTVPDFLELQRHSKTLEDLFLADFRPFVATGGIPDQVRGLAFSPNAFDFMGVPALRPHLHPQRYSFSANAAPARGDQLSFLAAPLRSGSTGNRKAA